MNDDKSATQDEFGRRPFAIHLAHALAAPRQSTGGLVVALDGEWGSGKSTLLEWIKDELGTIKPARFARDLPKM